MSKTNPRLSSLVAELKSVARDADANVWKDVAARLETLGKATIDLARAVDDSDHLSSLGPQI